MSQTSSDGSELTVRDEHQNEAAPESTVGIPLSEKFRDRIHYWIPNVSNESASSSDSCIDSASVSFVNESVVDRQEPMKTSESVICDEFQSLDLGDSCDSDDDEYEVNAIQILFRNGGACMLAQKYSDAETLLRCGLSKAESMNSKIQFGLKVEDQRLQLALALLYQANLEEAMPALVTLSQGRSSCEQDSCRILRALHGLAQAYCCNDDYLLAENASKKAIKG